MSILLLSIKDIHGLIHVSSESERDGRDAEHAIHERHLKISECPTVLYKELRLQN